MLHPTIPLKQNKTSSGKQVDKICTHNRFVFYSCNRELRIDLAHDAAVGEHCIKQKKFYVHQEQSMSSSSNEREECIYIPL